MPPRSKPQPLPSPSPRRAVEPPRGFRTQPISTRGRAGLPLRTEQRPESSLPAGQATRSSAASIAPLSRGSLGPRRTFRFCGLKICISLGSTGEIPTGKHSRRKTHKSRGFLPHRSPSSARTPRTQKTASGNMLAFAPGVTRPFPGLGRAGRGPRTGWHCPTSFTRSNRRAAAWASRASRRRGAGGVGGMLGARPSGSCRLAPSWDAPNRQDQEEKENFQGSFEGNDPLWEILAELWLPLQHSRAWCVPRQVCPLAGTGVHGGVMSDVMWGCSGHGPARCTPGARQGPQVPQGYLMLLP